MGREHLVSSTGDEPMGETTAEMLSSIIAGRVQIAAGTVLVSKAPSLSCWRGAATCKREGHIATHGKPWFLCKGGVARVSKFRCRPPPSSTPPVLPRTRGVGLVVKSGTPYTPWALFSSAHDIWGVGKSSHPSIWRRPVARWRPSSGRQKWRPRLARTRQRDAWRAQARGCGSIQVSPWPRPHDPALAIV